MQVHTDPKFVVVWFTWKKKILHNFTLQESMANADDDETYATFLVMIKVNIYAYEIQDILEVINCSANFYAYRFLLYKEKKLQKERNQALEMNRLLWFLLLTIEWFTFTAISNMYWLFLLLMQNHWLLRNKDLSFAIEFGILVLSSILKTWWKTIQMKCLNLLNLMDLDVEWLSEA